MCKKLINIIIVTIILLFNCNYFVCIADDENEIIENKDYIDVSNLNVEDLQINSKIAVVYDRKSNTVIWGKNENKRTAMASTTKIMTCIVAIEKCSNLSELITISKKAALTGGSRLGLKTNDKITMNDLLYGLMLKSGNDAAVAIAERIGGNVNDFACLMNEKAVELGLENTHFVTPHGLDNPEHYTTAYELAKLADYALQNELFAKIVNTKSYTVNINGYNKQIANTNELLGYLKGVNGVKTGFTNNAGRCLVTSVNRDGFDIITVIIQADTRKIRTTDSIKLIEYIYDNYTLVNIKDIVDNEFNKWCLINKQRININKQKNDNLELYYKDLKNYIIPIKKKEVDKISIEINCVYNYEAPVVCNTVMGTLKVMLNGEIIDFVDVCNKYEIQRKSIWDYMKIFMKKF